MNRPDSEQIASLLNDSTLQAAIAALILWKRGVLVVAENKLNEFMDMENANKQFKNNR